MIRHDDQPRARRHRRRPLTWLLVGVLLAAAAAAAAAAGAACSGEGDGTSAPSTSDPGPNAVVLPTLAGGVELPAVDPVSVLVGEGLAFGQALPSQQRAADAFLEDPEVAAVLARQLYSRLDGRRVGEVLVLSLDGHELFDLAVLDAFARGVVGALGDGTVEELALAGRPTLRSRGEQGTAIGFLEGDLLTVVRGRVDADVAVVVERQLVARAAGAVGAADPFTPLVPVPIGAAFVPVPTIAFQPVPPPEDEPSPVPPPLAGTTGIEARYGVVAGERRTTVWAITVDPAVYPSAEALEPVLAALVSARTGGAPTEAAEVVDRVVQRATAVDGSTSAGAFRLQGLVLFVEGIDAAQVDAVLSAWITALTTP